MKILLIEDEPLLQDTIKKYLSGEGYLCETASDYFTASEKITLYNYDCVVVDIAIPNGTGLQLIEELKEKRSAAGIIIISAKNSLEDKLQGLHLGSDDYLTKPFHLPELNARIQALMRRKNFDGSNSISFDVITIDTVARKVSVNKNEVNLTAKEYDLLLYFMTNKNKVLSKNAIAEHLWGDDMDQVDSYNFLYTHIKNLRKKLMEKGAPDYIQTVYGIGYSFKPV